MIKKKLKVCRGIGKAKDYGCGDDKLIHKYGLCTGCFAKWLYNSEEGQQVLKKSVLRAKGKVRTDNKIKHNQARQDIKKKAEFEKDLQTEVNTIVRLIDVDKGCISCGHGWKEGWTRQAHAGHYYSVGSDPTLRFNFFNIWKQCSICNNFKGGNERAYADGIIERYGKMTLLRMNGLKAKYKEIHLAKHELIEKIKIARKIKRAIKSGKDYTRDELNDQLGIY